MSVIGSFFSLPPELFKLAVPTEGAANSSLGTTETDVRSESRTNPTTTDATYNDAGATCVACGIGTILPMFASVAEQREHFKTDWHRFNLRRRLQKQSPVSEEEFERLLEQDDGVSSISGSDEESSSGSEDEDAPVARASRHKATSSGPQTVFVSQGTPFAVWRCLLTQDHLKTATSATDQLLALRHLRATGGHWVVLLLRGGHFAAAVFQMKESSRPQRSTPAGSSTEAAGNGMEAAGASGRGGRAGAGDGFDGCFELVAHKTFHRYVVRAKAGGKQSTKDATGKFARSAGSRLRRYNEQALERDIHDLLNEWRAHLQSAALVFIQAPSSNLKTLLPSINPPISPSDPRLRRVPFVTQRPTFSETKRVLRVLTNVYHASLPESTGEDNKAGADEAAAEHPQAQAASRAEAGAATAASAVRDEDGLDGAEDGAEAAEGVGGDGRGGSGAGASTSGRGVQQDTPLHKAAKAGDAERVASLLEGGADPAVGDARGKVPYLLAVNKEVRDAFRRAMAREPDRWDWVAAAVPSPLTEELEAAQASKRDAKKARQKAKQKEQKEQREKKKAAGGGAGQGSGQKGLEEDEEDEISKALREAAAITAKAEASRKAKQAAKGGPGGRAAAAPVPTAQDAAKRREQLAAAAEARMKALQSAAGKQQLW